MGGAGGGPPVLRSVDGEGAQKYPSQHQERIYWENIFIENCTTLTQEFTWATRMIELVRNYQLPKSSYFAEVAALKREAEVEAPTTTELLTTPAELTNFKDNMKRSVILSVAASKISSVNAPQIASMIGPPLRSRIAIERSFHLNSEYRNSQLKFERAKSLSSKGSLCRSIISLIDDTISSVMGADREISKQAARDIELFLKFSMIL